jgi:hypothetical protein
VEPIGWVLTTEPEPGVVCLRLLDREPAAPIPSVHPGPDPRPLGQVTVRFDDDQVQDVTVALEGGIVADDLRRLPWSRLLRAAEAYWRAQRVRTADAYYEAVRAEWAVHDGDTSRRPGRPALSKSFYHGVAVQYDELVKQGVRDPVQRIAAARNQDRSTVAGWIRKARAHSFLPEARRGRAG